MERGTVLRTIFLALLLANLIFFAWANLIDVTPPPPNDALGPVPRLELASEVKARPARGTVPAEIRVPAATEVPAATKIATPANAIGRGSAAGSPDPPTSPVIAPTTGPVSVATPATSQIPVGVSGAARAPAHAPGAGLAPGPGRD